METGNTSTSNTGLRFAVTPELQVCQGWAYGIQAIPRVGSEVLVSFMEGDPDQPVITGRVHHANSRPPMQLPHNKSQTVLRTQTVRGTKFDEGFNELRFEDIAGSEQIYIHAQRDMDTDVLNDRSTTVNHDHNEKIGNNQTITVTGSQTLSVEHNRRAEITGNQTTTVQGDEILAISGDHITGAGKNSALLVKGDITLQSETGSITLITAGGHISIGHDGIIGIKGKHVIIEGDRTDLNPGFLQKLPLGSFLPAAGDTRQLPEEIKFQELLGISNVWDVHSGVVKPPDVTPLYRLPVTETITQYDYTLQDMVDKQAGLKGKGIPVVFDSRNNQHTASKEEIKQYVNPENFMTGVSKYQFIDISAPSGVAEGGIKQFLKNKGILKGKEKIYMYAANKYHISEVYLAAHSALETGNGTSELAKGIKIHGKTVYNMFGIGAKNGKAISAGAEYAYNNNWTTPEKAIEGGAKWIAKNYIEKGQNTLCKMRWNPANPATHQYSTDIGWAGKQAYVMKKLFDNFPDARLSFDIPEFKK